MKTKPYDGKIYLVFGLVVLAISLIVAGTSAYSIFSVEPKVRLLLDSENEADWRRAYVALREPQVFAGYDNFDRESMGVKRLLSFFDEAVYSGTGIASDQLQYLELLLERRHSGSVLGFKSAAFCLIVSILSFVMFVAEILSARKNRA